MKTVSFKNLDNLKREKGGLSALEVATQRSRYGFNDIVEVPGHPWGELLLNTIKDPMIWFLIGIGTLFWLLGERGDAITLYVAVLPLVLMDAFLHWRTEASTVSLKNQLSSHVKVIRDENEVEINSRDLVPGDLVVLSPGIQLPADGLFDTAENIQVDESALTGESLPIVKKTAAINPFLLSAKPQVNVTAENLGYAGTRVLTGHGFLRVLFTGVQTSYGEIVQSVARMPHEPTPLQKSIRQLVQVLIFAAFAFCFFLAGVRIYQGHGWFDALISAATLGVAAMPEEFPLAFTFFLGVGVYRLAKKRALVRQAVSVENIGRITTICTDKTGTITAGNLNLIHIESQQGISNDHLLRAAMVASSSQSDPIDVVIRETAEQKKLETFDRLKTQPFTEDRKRESAFIKMTSEKVLVCMKGAPEKVLMMSHLTESEKQDWRKRVSAWAHRGCKVIACAQAEVSTEAQAEPESGYNFLGLLVFADPIRPEVINAMAYCRKTQIKVLMITGDHPETAAAIAREAGLTAHSLNVVSAEDESQKFEETWLNKNPDFLKSLHVVARCTPMQKLKIVTALKQAGEIVAVTGDGVNDVPALKAADVGIAMGERGTRSAKEVSSIILSDDNFNTIVNAIREGRQLFKNLTKSFEYLLLMHIPLVTVGAIIPLAGYPLVFLPIHIVWLELIIHPTALLSFQTAASDHQALPKTKGLFFSKGELMFLLLLGLVLAVVMGWSFLSAVTEANNPEHGRAKVMAVFTLWSAITGTYLTAFRSLTANVIAAVTAASIIILIQAANLLGFLKLAPLHLSDWIEVILLIAGVLALTWGVEFLHRTRFKDHIFKPNMRRQWR